MTKYNDVISTSDITAQPLEEKTPVDKPEKGDFYFRIRDLRDGKLFYFRGYITGITENLTPTWNPITYIGRSEDIWTYQKGERDISFNLRLAPQNSTEFSMMYKKLGRLTSLIYPRYLAESAGMTRMQPPFTEIYMAHIGSRTAGRFGYFKSFTYTVNEQGDWDALSNRPRVIDIAVSYQILSKKPPSYSDKFYGEKTPEEIHKHSTPVDPFGSLPGSQVPPNFGNNA